MKKKIIIVFGVVCLVLVGSFIGMKINASNPQPGSIQDPLITKAYLEVRLNKLRTDLGLQPEIIDNTGSGDGDISSGTIETLAQYFDEEIAKIKLELDSKIEAIQTSGGTEPAGFVPINVPKGVKIICKEGTEVIVRSGKATAIASPENMGLSNVSTGKDLMTGHTIPLNNLIIIARTDGRGFESHSDGTYVMIKGEYTIE